MRFRKWYWQNQESGKWQNIFVNHASRSQFDNGKSRRLMRGINRRGVEHMRGLLFGTLEFSVNMAEDLRFIVLAVDTVYSCKHSAAKEKENNNLLWIMCCRTLFACKCLNCDWVVAAK